jgi:FkbM family methyltransferase
MNIGSNLTPIVPTPQDDPCTVAIAFEPIVAAQIPPHPALHVVAAAVTPEAGWAAMHVYNRNGLSSSLTKPSYEGKWNQNGGSLKVVPTMSLRTILASLQPYTIDFIKTDMQGHDFSAISSAGDLLVQQGVKRLMTEVYWGNVVTYQGIHNDFCKDWWPYMTKIGYVFEGLSERHMAGYGNAEELAATCRKEMEAAKDETAGLQEINALWRLRTETSMGLGVYEYGVHQSKRAGHQFTNEEYARCHPQENATDPRF